MAELSRDLKKVCLKSLELGAYPNSVTFRVGSIQIMLKMFPFQAVTLSGNYLISDKFRSFSRIIFWVVQTGS